jgi:hypothetical protein
MEISSKDFVQFEEATFEYELMGFGGMYTGQALVSENRDGLRTCVPNGKGNVYFKGGATMLIQGNFLGGKQTGEFVKYWTSGTREFSGSLLDGLKDGWCEYYYKNNLLHYRLFYQRDKVAPRVYNFNNQNGKLRYKGQVDSNGSFRGFGAMYFANGQLAFIGKFSGKDPLIWVGSHFLRHGKKKIMNRVVRRNN